MIWLLHILKQQKTLKKKIIGLIDGQSGNIGSIKNAIKDIIKDKPYQLKIIQSQFDPNQFSKIVLPGQGAYATLVANLKKLKIYKMIKRDLLQQKIASTLEDRDIIVSPYEDLKNIILAEIDIIKKFANLDKFIDQFCRVANMEEDGYWFYCIDSGVKCSL